MDKEKSDRRIHKLAYWRKIVGLKQEDMALLLGCKTSNYCSKETGRIIITRDEMVKIVKAFNKILEKRGAENIGMDDLFMP